MMKTQSVVKGVKGSGQKESPILYMAPLKGVTDHIVRNGFMTHFGGFDKAIAPFIVSIQGTSVRRNYVKELWPENNTGMPVIPQILSKSASDFIRLANYLTDFGYKTVNWNLGCPYPLSPQKNRGSWLLQETDWIDSFLEKVIPALKPKLSLKTRLGHASRDDIINLIPVLNQYPLEEIIIHPRTGVQRYTGATDLDTFEKCLTLLHHQIVYNGDIRSFADYKYLSERFKTINRWMLGRGALADPFLPMIIKTGKDSVDDRVTVMKQFHDDLYHQYEKHLNSPVYLLNRMKGLWKFFSIPFSTCGKILNDIQKADQAAQYLRRVNQFFEKEAVWRHTACPI